jgi:hypothetical protein
MHFSVAILRILATRNLCIDIGNECQYMPDEEIAIYTLLLHFILIVLHQILRLSLIDMCQYSM